MRKAKTKKPGKVQKIIKTHHSPATEKAEITIDGADDLYKEIRIDNTLEDEHGKKVKLKEGADVEVVIKADEDAITPEH